VDADCYLERLGLARVDVEARDRDALERLQRAHVRAIPFENLSIAGDPVGAGSEGAEEKERAGVSLDLEDLYRKVVERERGGFCYELNGLFGWLLAELGFQTERLAARVLDDDGRARPPANHHTNAVTLDRRYVVDVGVAVPTIRQPLPLDGSVREDEVGVAWRVARSERPDADYCTEFRNPGEDWEKRYVFRDRPVELGFFGASCEFLATAPESPFTGEPFVTIATGRGHRKLEPGTLTVIEGGETRERPVEPREWHDVLEREFGLAYRGGDEQ
jgi:N-hydroxyarylamine O-acetyltransferase